MLTFSTLNNPYEQHKVLISGEGYAESITFEGLPAGRYTLRVVAYGDHVLRECSVRLEAGGTHDLEDLVVR